MITFGRCHGPGCQQAARVEFWCSEACASRWHRQLDVAPLVDPSGTVGDIRVLVALNGHMAAAEADTLVDATDRAVQMVAELSALPPMQPGFGSLPDAVEGDSTERLCASASATYPLVASENPQVAHDRMCGWLGRWLHRMRRTP